jgi:TfoX/Sxy family transcriptional regulator of competence genes
MDNDSLREILSKVTPPEAEVEFKKMFGGLMAYTHGRVFASISNVGLALKLDKAVHEEMVKAGGNYLQYEEGQVPNKQYLTVSAAMLADPTQLSPWVKKSLDFVMTLPAPVKKEKKPRAKKAKSS